MNMIEDANDKIDDMAEDAKKHMNNAADTIHDTAEKVADETDNDDM